MKSVLLVMCVLFAFNVLSQDNYLSISQPGSEKETIFKEDKRVRVKTIQGAKLSGKLHFVNEKQIMIKNITIPINSISQIKHNPLLLNILTSGTLIFAGGFGVIIGIAGIAWGAILPGIGVGLLGAATMYAGIMSPNILSATYVHNTTTVKTAKVLQ
ncbi:hypothetical protein OU798_00170 [Prolixibacteraceae bacterium Z1-6]|uniref:Glycine zipper family protein n=1 Tax=Draconibacterium aestuarii TaxID=2998507 RepID=A0A9X3F1G9_9BACT|nr:hypothetical protein [Prolixibacteraceae bacterium Z1-6]